MKKNLRQTVYDKFEGHCAYCGTPMSIDRMQIDHIVPKYSFEHDMRFNRAPEHLKHLQKVDDMDNLNPSCAVCNKWKSAHRLEFFRSEIAEQIKRLNACSANFRMAKRYGQVAETPQPVKFYFETVREMQAVISSVSKS